MRSPIAAARSVTPLHPHKVAGAHGTSSHASAAPAARQALLRAPTAEAHNAIALHPREAA